MLSLSRLDLGVFLGPHNPGGRRFLWVPRLSNYDGATHTRPVSRSPPRLVRLLVRVAQGRAAHWVRPLRVAAPLLCTPTPPEGSTSMGPPCDFSFSAISHPPPCAVFGANTTFNTAAVAPPSLVRSCSRALARWSTARRRGNWRHRCTRKRRQKFTSCTCSSAMRCDYHGARC